MAVRFDFFRVQLWARARFDIGTSPPAIFLLLSEPEVLNDRGWSRGGAGERNLSSIISISHKSETELGAGPCQPIAAKLAD